MTEALPPALTHTRHDGIHVPQIQPPLHMRRVGNAHRQDVMGAPNHPYTRENDRGWHLVHKILNEKFGEKILCFLSITLQTHI